MGGRFAVFLDEGERSCLGLAGFVECSEADPTADEGWTVPFRPKTAEPAPGCTMMGVLFRGRAIQTFTSGN
jgi:hypothetical protein